jgi:hypothetical protein
MVGRASLQRPCLFESRQRTSHQTRAKLPKAKPAHVMSQCRIGQYLSCRTGHENGQLVSEDNSWDALRICLLMWQRTSSVVVQPSRERWRGGGRVSTLVQLAGRIDPGTICCREVGGKSQLPRGSTCCKLHRIEGKRRRDSRAERQREEPCRCERGGGIEDVGCRQSCADGGRALTL